MKLPIITIPNKILRRKSLAVKNITSDIVKLAQDMQETYKIDGVGLAAPQVSQNVRMCVIGNTNSRKDENSFDEKILINPEIISKSKEKDRDIEGCLSVPNITAVIERYSTLEYKYMDLTGQTHHEKISGYEARVIQHEIDHLDGVLFTDRIKKYNVVFFGTPEFAVPALQQLIAHPQFNVVAAVCETDKPAGRGHVLTSSPVKIVAMNANIPVFQPRSFNIKHANDDLSTEARKTIDDLSALKPDFIIVAAYGKILPRYVLDIAKIAPINIHPSLLPLHRGPDPIRAAIIEDDENTGVSIMVMTPEMDAGPVLSMTQIRILPDDNYSTLSNKLSNIGADQLIYTLEELLSDKATLYKQNEEAATYSQKTSADSRVIDWRKSSLEIHNLIRAFSPHDGVTTEIDNQIVKILGSVYEDGQLKLTSVQMPGKKSTEYSQFKNGHPKLYKLLQSLVDGINNSQDATKPKEVVEQLS